MPLKFFVDDKVATIAGGGLWTIKKIYKNNTVICVNDKNKINFIFKFYDIYNKDDDSTNYYFYIKKPFNKNYYQYIKNIFLNEITTHKLSKDDVVVISGASSPLSSFNGEFKITEITNSTSSTDHNLNLLWNVDSVSDSINLLFSNIKKLRKNQLVSTIYGGGDWKINKIIKNFVLCENCNTGYSLLINKNDIFEKNNITYYEYYYNMPLDYDEIIKAELNS